MGNKPAIVGLGEALFDLYLDRRPASEALPADDAAEENAPAQPRVVIGGAPLNVAFCAHQLGAGRIAGSILSRIGDDELGRRVLEELRRRGMTRRYLQIDPVAATGRVHVKLDAGGQVQFHILEDAAWDGIVFNDDADHLARHCAAVCFGSLAQRDPRSRLAIRQFAGAAAKAARLFDVNLRQHYFDRSVLEESCAMATMLKLNDQELPVVGTLLEIGSSDDADHQARALVERFDLELLALTRGDAGTVLYAAGGKYAGELVSYPPAEDADPVGAGDACSAALLVGKVLGLSLERTLQLANHAGAYVASRPGGTPPLPQQIIDMAV